MKPRTSVPLTCSLLALFLWTGCDSANTPTEPQLRPEVSLLPSMSAIPQRPLVLDYIKTESGAGTANWFGNVSGDIIGDLETQVVGLRVAGKIWHIQTVWMVSADAESFVAHLNGMLDTSSGKLVLNGEIVSGYLAGARIHDEGVLTGFTQEGGTIFEGFLRVMPASAH